jgi:hypothetical protein
MRLAAAGAAWILVQALVNICAVAPDHRCAAPLISAGLSSLRHDGGDQHAALIRQARAGAARRWR